MILPTFLLANFLFNLFTTVSASVESTGVGNGVQATADMYVFAYTWQAEFCYGKSNYYGCEHPEEYWQYDFTVHGLWPQYSSGGYPSSCTNEAFNASVVDAIGWDEMTTYWPNVQYTTTDPNYTDFWEHEWSKHGTCSGLSQYDYFTASLNLIKQLGTPSDYSAAVGGYIDATQLRNDFGGANRAALQCTSSKYVNGVYTCWNQQNGIPTTQRDCPSDVVHEDTCTVQSLYVESLL